MAAKIIAKSSLSRSRAKQKVKTFFNPAYFINKNSQIVKQ